MLLELAKRYSDLIQEIEIERFRVVGASYELRAVISLRDGSKLFVKDYLFLDGTRKYAYSVQRFSPWRNGGAAYTIVNRKLTGP